MKTVAIASGKGGVGKTTLTANLGTALASSGERVVLFDADLGLANLDIALGLKSETNIQHVVEGTVQLEEALAQGPAGVRVLTGASGIGSLIRLGRKRINSLIEETQKLENSTDTLIFDAASGADARVMTFLKSVDTVILVTTPDPASIVDCYSTAKVLFRYKKDADIKILVNRAGSADQAKLVSDTIRSTTKKFLRKPVDYLGFVRDDAKAAEIVRNRKLFILECPELAASEDVRALSEKLTGKHPALTQVAA